MLDVRKIGAFISTLRKGKDLTQLELAEQLNVSHQAVSKWERGDSLPDIGTFPQIAKFFGVTVDELLNGNAAKENDVRGGQVAIEQLALNRPEKISGMINIGQLDLDAVAHIAPMVKTSTLDKIAERVDKGRFSADHILELAPFLGQDVLDILALQLAEDADHMKWDIVTGIAPFVSRETLTKLANKAVDGSVDARLLVGIAPFLGRETIDRLARQVADGRMDWDIVQELAPFISRETLTMLVDQVMEEGQEMDRIAGLAPFLDREHVDRLVLRAADEQLSPDLISGLAPFASQDTLRQLVMRMVGSTTK